jgi:hypothetical protein
MRRDVMGLLRKFRILAGALVHRPFMPRQEKVDLDEETKAAAEGGSPRKDLEARMQEPDVSDGERVADLIAKKQREHAD